MTNLQLLQQFSSVTGIRDLKTEMLVAGHESGYIIGVDYGTGYSRSTVSTYTQAQTEEEFKVRYLGEFPTLPPPDPPKSKSIYPWLFDDVSKPSFTLWPFVIDADDCEANRVREYRNRVEKEWTLRDIIPLDGWIPKED